MGSWHHREKVPESPLVMEEKLENANEGCLGCAKWGQPHKPVHPKELPLSPNSASFLGSLHERGLKSQEGWAGCG